MSEYATTTSTTTIRVVISDLDKPNKNKRVYSDSAFKEKLYKNIPVLLGPISDYVLYDMRQEDYLGLADVTITNSHSANIEISMLPSRIINFSNPDILKTIFDKYAFGFSGIGEQLSSDNCIATINEYTLKAIEMFDKEISPPSQNTKIIAITHTFNIYSDEKFEMTEPVK